MELPFVLPGSGGELNVVFDRFFRPAAPRRILKCSVAARALRFAVALWFFAASTSICIGQQPGKKPVQKPTQQRQSALALEREGKVAEAEAAWKTLLIGQPSNSEAYAHLGLLEAHQEHYKEAIVFYRKALSLNPKIPGLRLNLGLSEFKAGELHSAIQTFDSLLKSEPKTSANTLRLATLIGLAHYGLGEYSASIPYLKDAAAGDPQSVSLRMTLAESCLLSKQYQCVLDVYKEILTLNPESADAHILAGEAYDELKNDDGALTEFQAAVNADPKMPNVHFGYGYLLWRRLKFDDAEKEFRSELANNPEHPLALAYLGDTEMRRNSLQDAVTHLEHAIRLQPSIAIAHLDLGIIFEGQGRKDEALAELRKAAELNPSDSAIHWRLGRFYQSLGQKEEAKREFDKAQSLLQANRLSIRDQMNQVDTKPAGQPSHAEPK